MPAHLLLRARLVGVGVVQQPALLRCESEEVGCEKEIGLRAFEVLKKSVKEDLFDYAGARIIFLQRSYTTCMRV